MIPFLAAEQNPMVHVLPQNLFRIGGIWITNHMVMATIAAVLMLLIFPVLFRRPVVDAPRGAGISLNPSWNSCGSKCFARR